jgi:hypothetical protein
MPSKPKPSAVTAAGNPTSPGSTSVATADNGGAARTRSRSWTVTIPYVPPTVVEAADEAEAWDKFRSKWGIVQSEHVPVIQPVGE